MSTKNVIALIGEKGAGKDSFYKSLEGTLYESGRAKHNILCNVKFATPLNTLINSAFGEATQYDQRDLKKFLDVYNHELLIQVNVMTGSPTLSDKILAELEDELMNSPDAENLGSGRFYVSWRTLAQLLGTEVIRKVAGDNFFVDQVQSLIDQTLTTTFAQACFVLTDARFGSEVGIAEKVYGIVRQDNQRYKVDPVNTHASELLGQVLSTAAYFYKHHNTDILIKQLQAFCINNGTKFAAIYESKQDADGRIEFETLWEDNE